MTILPFRARRSLPRAGLLVVVTLAIALIVSGADRSVRPLLCNTVLFAGTAGVLALPLGLMLALIGFRSNLPGSRLVPYVSLAMIFLPAYLQVTGWEAAFGQQGWFGGEWLARSPWALLAGWRGALFMQTLVNLPWVVLMLGSALATIPVELEEQASLYAAPLGVLRFVTLPQLRATLVAALLWVSVLAAGDITVTDMYQIRTFAEEVFTGFALGDQLIAASRRYLAGSLLILVAVLAALFACREVTRNIGGWPARRPRTVGRTGRIGRWVGGIFVFGGCAIWLGIPLGSLLYQAGLEVLPDGANRIRRWSGLKCVEILTDTPLNFGRDVAWSFALGQLVALTVVVLSLGSASRGRASRLVRGVAWSATLLGLAIPGPILALAVARMVNQPSQTWLAYLYDRTLFVPWLALTLRLFPYGYLLASLLIQRLDPRPLEIAQLAGASRWQSVRFVLAPALMTAALWLWLVILALTLGDVTTTVMAVPPGVTTLAIRIFNLVHYGVADQLAGLCLEAVLLFVTFAALVLALAPFGRGGGDPPRRDDRPAQGPERPEV